MWPFITFNLNQNSHNIIIAHICEESKDPNMTIYHFQRIWIKLDWCSTGHAITLWDNMLKLCFAVWDLICNFNRRSRMWVQVLNLSQRNCGFTLAAALSDNSGQILFRAAPISALVAQPDATPSNPAVLQDRHVKQNTPGSPRTAWIP